MTLHVTTRGFAARARQYDVGDLVDPDVLTDDERRAGFGSGAIVPVRFVGTAANLAARNPVPGPGVACFETDTGVLRVGTTGATAYSSLPVAGYTSYARRVADWATGVGYAIGELVVSAGTLYRCTTAHTSGGAFAAGNFTAVSGGGGGSVVSIDSDGTLVVDGTTVELATDADLAAAVTTLAVYSASTFS